MHNKKFTPERITSLAKNEIFVFGSNLAGSHGGGAARLAYNRFGAVWGQGVGLQGQSYAIPTMQGGAETIKPYVDEFIRFAKENQHLTFLVTRIGCGIAGFRDDEIAPLFKEALNLENVILPKEFVDCLEESRTIEPTEVEIKWDSSEFLTAYHPLMQKAAKGDRVAYYKVKELRAQEYRNTIEIVNQGFYTTEDGKRVTFPDLTRMEHDTTFYEREFRVDDIPAREERTQFMVRNVDCLEEGVRLILEGYNPAVLNMASRRNPGGGVMTGAGAQEETLFRRTNLFRSLYQFTEQYMEHSWYNNHITPAKTGERYPMHRDFGGVYTPDALLFREDEQHGYKLMDTPERLSFIAVAGINRPELKDATHLADNMIEGTKNKMRTILRIGLRHGHDSLVLGALGCGAFCNPPSHIARLFHEVFEEPEFKNKYRLICFAILDDHNAHRNHNPEGNFIPFEKEFENNNVLEPESNSPEYYAFYNGFDNLGKCLHSECFLPKQSMRWALYSNGILEISGIGKMPDFINHWFSYTGEGQAPWIGCEKYGVMPHKLIIRDGITYIGANSFESFGCLEEVYLANSVKYLGRESFFDCFNIKMINKPRYLDFHQFLKAELPLYYNNEYRLERNLLIRKNS